MKTIIVDYDAGNLKSVANMLKYIGVDFEVTSDKDKILSAGKIIFPGQGHFGQSIGNLRNKGLEEPIKTCIAKGTPFLGICIGLQILFESSEEAPEVQGLGILKGTVKKFTKGKIPQIGWNRVKTTLQNSYLPDDYFYFVNSYYVEPEDSTIISSYCDYNGDFCASIEKDNLTAVQFHPEKSSEAGLLFFKNWLKNS